MQSQKLSDILEEKFSPFLLRYGMNFKKHYTPVGHILYPLLFPSHIIYQIEIAGKVVEALVIHNGETPEQIESHILELVKLIRARQTRGELPGFILVEKEPMKAPKFFPQIVRRIKA